MTVLHTVVSGSIPGGSTTNTSIVALGRELGAGDSLPKGTRPAPSSGAYSYMEAWPSLAYGACLENKSR